MTEERQGAIVLSQNVDQEVDNAPESIFMRKNKDDGSETEVVMWNLKDMPDSVVNAIVSKHLLKREKTYISVSCGKKSRCFVPSPGEGGNKSVVEFDPIANWSQAGPIIEMWRVCLTSKYVKYIDTNMRSNSSTTSQKAFMAWLYNDFSTAKAQYDVLNPRKAAMKAIVAYEIGGPLINVPTDWFSPKIPDKWRDHAKQKR